MMFRFVCEGTVGLVALILVITFGGPGASGLALLALLPILLRLRQQRRYDERELQLFYKASNYGLGLTIVFLVSIYFGFDLQIGKETIGENWLPITVSLILLARSVAGLVVFRFH